MVDIFGDRVASREGWGGGGISHSAFGLSIERRKGLLGWGREGTVLLRLLLR